MENKICCVLPVSPNDLPFGENEEDERFIKLKENLIAAIRRLSKEREITVFSTDLSRGVSLLCAELLLGMGEDRPRVEASIPYEDQAELWTESLRDRYFQAAEHCDITTMFSRSYVPMCEKENIRRMIEASDTVLAVWDGTQGDVTPGDVTPRDVTPRDVTPNGTTAAWVDYAVKCGCEVLIVAP